MENLNKMFQGEEDEESMRKFRNKVQKIVDQFQSMDTIPFISELERYQLEQEENNRDHQSMKDEKIILQLVRNGDVDGMIRYLLENPADIKYDSMGVVARNETKRFEYYIVTMIVLCSRAAMEGGMNSELAYELSDIFLQQLSQRSNTADMMTLSVWVGLAFARAVKENRKKSTSPYVEACKDYIYQNLRKPFRISEIGEKIGVNSSYLSKQFSKEEGMTISQYVNRERCSHAANLLRYSDYDISEIAEYFCYSSHSHFGVQFKKIYGMTPNEYRRQYFDKKMIDRQ